ncbi:3-dehydroquinate synthase II [Methanofollis fontis]|uniref:3-dehydroquinate synthase n=1 Tax=Methanofollis fontis TaxID=2052832 RepID=A0A483CV50_9EURY|nr:3-dehydroquinate synthase II [Methanofollis fontis]TAJ45351.1 3-dehydroquinate synthase II [Methanofollis fontis]
MTGTSKRFWVDVRPWSTEIATAAIEAGADALVADRAADARALGRIATVAPDGDLVPERDVVFAEVTPDSPLPDAGDALLVVSTTDWTVIPLENLVAAFPDRVIAVVSDADEARLALGILERGVAGVLLRTADPLQIGEVAAVLRDVGGRYALAPFTVTRIVPVGMGDRACIDTCSLLAEGEGMLVGNTSSGFLLVLAETAENPYVAPRPFRVNAGAVHAYLLGPDGRTSYLSEVRAGNSVLVIGADGTGETAAVGRVKIERRPLLLVEAESGGAKAGLVLQNAETVRLMGESGPLSVAALSVGDRVLGVSMEKGRHFGMAVGETITET